MRRVSRAWVAVPLVVMAVALAGCSDIEVTSGSAPVTPVGLSADGSTFTVRLSDAWVGPNAGDRQAIQSVSYVRFFRLPLAGLPDTYVWMMGAVQTVVDGGTTGVVTDLISGGTSLSGTFTIPTQSVESKIWVQVRSTKRTVRCAMAGYDCDFETYSIWSNAIVVPPRPMPPTARVFARNVPAGETGTVLDARLSTGTGPLSYAWAPACFQATGYDGNALPTGVTRVPIDYIGPCAVTVTDANGLTSTESINVAAAERTRMNALFSFAGSFVTIIGPRAGDTTPTFACVNLDGAAPLTQKVVLDGRLDDGTPIGTVELPTGAAGLHRVTAAFWEPGTNDDCANTGLSGTGLLQVASDLYLADGAAGRSLRAAYTAPSALRLRASTILREGKINAVALRSGAIVRGRFTWAMPASGGGARRPAALAGLRSGTYVSRVRQLLFGPSVGSGKVALVGTTTVLLRSPSGALACARMDGVPDGSSFRLIGGTGALARQSAALVGGPAAYRLPSTPAGWRSAKVRPTRIAGTMTAATSAAPAKLPAACKALRRYLP